MALVRDHRRVGLITEEGIIGNRQFIGVRWCDYTATYIRADAVQPCDAAGLRQWVADRLGALALELERVGVPDGLALVRDVAATAPLLLNE
jgi:hypothetical protein